MNRCSFLQFAKRKIKTTDFDVERRWRRWRRRSRRRRIQCIPKYSVTHKTLQENKRKLTKEVGEEEKDAMIVRAVLVFKGQEGKESLHMCCPHSFHVSSSFRGNHWKEAERRGGLSNRFITVYNNRVHCLHVKGNFRPRESRTSSLTKKNQTIAIKFLYVKYGQLLLSWGWLHSMTTDGQGQELAFQEKNQLVNKWLNLRSSFHF